MPKFQVLCSETVCYRVVVEAESAKEAEQMVADGQVDLGNPVDGDNFEIDEVELLGETNA